MLTRGDAYARQLTEATSEVARTIERLGDIAWQATTGPEGWTAAATAHHVASIIELVAGLVQMIAQGRELPIFTVEILDGQNAEHARPFAGCSKQETLELLETNTNAAEQMLRNLTEEQIDRTTIFFDQPITNAFMIENVLIGHAINHEKSISALATTA